MSKTKELEQLLEKEILPEINDYIDDLFEVIAAKKDTPEIKEELQHIQEMKTDFLAMLEEAKKNEIDEEEAIEIIQELQEMKQE
jgi:hypothetical protein